MKIIKSYSEPNKTDIWFNKKDNSLYHYNNGKWIGLSTSLDDNFIENNIVFLTAKVYTDLNNNTIYELLGNWDKVIENDNIVYKLIN